MNFLDVVCVKFWLSWAKCGYSFPPGEYDALPEQAFYMVGPIEEVVEKAAQMAKDLA